MMKGVEVVGARHGDVVRAYTSHWVTQVSFDEPIVMASVSPKHDTYPLMIRSGEFSVSILAGDQIAEGQYFSYPGRKFRHMASEYLADWPDDPTGPPIVPNSIAWLRCRIVQQLEMADHELLFARVESYAEGRLGASPLLYSSRAGWRVAGDKAREPGVSIRDQLLQRLAEEGLATDEPD
jgi:flavin reductase (DIM6/NTAB) family NADH-FMN oxidoreductase RutF